jgi:hypothetical protein
VRTTNDQTKNQTSGECGSVWSSFTAWNRAVNNACAGFRESSLSEAGAKPNPNKSEIRLSL